MCVCIHKRIYLCVYVRADKVCISVCGNVCSYSVLSGSYVNASSMFACMFYVLTMVCVWYTISFEVIKATSINRHHSAIKYQV